MARMTILPLFALLAAGAIVVLTSNAPVGFAQQARDGDDVQLVMGCTNVTLT